MRIKVDLPIGKPLRGGGGGILRIQKGKELGSLSSMNGYPLFVSTVV